MDCALANLKRSPHESCAGIHLSLKALSSCRMVDKRFRAGDLVWAKMPNYPHWPGRIMAPDDDMTKICGPLDPKKGEQHYVYFFGTDNYAPIPIKRILSHSQEMFDKQDNKKRISKNLRAAINAMKEYCNLRVALDLNLNEPFSNDEDPSCDMMSRVKVFTEHSNGNYDHLIGKLKPCEVRLVRAEINAVCSAPLTANVVTQQAIEIGFASFSEPTTSKALTAENETSVNCELRTSEVIAEQIMDFSIEPSCEPTKPRVVSEYYIRNSDHLIDKLKPCEVRLVRVDINAVCSEPLTTNVVTQKTIEIGVASISEPTTPKALTPECEISVSCELRTSEVVAEQAMDFSIEPSCKPTMPKVVSEHSIGNSDHLIDKLKPCEVRLVRVDINAVCSEPLTTNVVTHQTFENGVASISEPTTPKAITAEHEISVSCELRTSEVVADQAMDFSIKPSFEPTMPKVVSENSIENLCTEPLTPKVVPEHSIGNSDHFSGKLTPCEVKPVRVESEINAVYSEPLTTITQRAIDIEQAMDISIEPSCEPTMPKSVSEHTIENLCTKPLTPKVVSEYSIGNSDHLSGKLTPSGVKLDRIESEINAVCSELLTTITQRAIDIEQAMDISIEPSCEPTMPKSVSEHTIENLCTKPLTPKVVPEYSIGNSDHLSGKLTPSGVKLDRIESEINAVCSELLTTITQRAIDIEQAMDISIEPSCEPTMPKSVSEHTIENLCTKPLTPKVVSEYSIGNSDHLSGKLTPSGVKLDRIESEINAVCSELLTTITQRAIDIEQAMDISIEPSCEPTMPKSVSEHTIENLCTKPLTPKVVSEYSIGNSDHLSGKLTPSGVKLDRIESEINAVCSELLTTITQQAIEIEQAMDISIEPSCEQTMPKSVSEHTIENLCTKPLTPKVVPEYSIGNSDNLSGKLTPCEVKLDRIESEINAVCSELLTTITQQAIEIEQAMDISIEPSCNNNAKAIDIEQAMDISIEPSCEPIMPKTVSEHSIENLCTKPLTPKVVPENSIGNSDHLSGKLTPCEVKLDRIESEINAVCSELLTTITQQAIEIEQAMDISIEPSCESTMPKLVRVDINAVCSEPLTTNVVTQKAIDIEQAMDISIEPSCEPIMPKTVSEHSIENLCTKPLTPKVVPENSIGNSDHLSGKLIPCEVKIDRVESEIYAVCSELLTTITQQAIEIEQAMDISIEPSCESTMPKVVSEHSNGNYDHLIGKLKPCEVRLVRAEINDVCSAPLTTNVVTQQAIEIGFASFSEPTTSKAMTAENEISVNCELRTSEVIAEQTIDFSIEPSCEPTMPKVVSENSIENLCTEPLTPKVVPEHSIGNSDHFSGKLTPCEVKLVRVESEINAVYSAPLTTNVVTQQAIEIEVPSISEPTSSKALTAEHLKNSDDLSCGLTMSNVKFNTAEYEITDACCEPSSSKVVAKKVTDIGVKTSCAQTTLKKVAAEQAVDLSIRSGCEPTMVEVKQRCVTDIPQSRLIGFLGLGELGLKFVRKLIETDHDVTVYDKNFDQLNINMLYINGATVANSIIDICAKCELIFCCTFAFRLVENLCGKDGILSVLAKNKDLKGFIEMTPMDENDLIITSEYLAYAKKPFLEVAVGAPWFLENGELNFLAAGCKNLFIECLPIFRKLSNVDAMYIGNKIGQAFVSYQMFNALTVSFSAISQEALDYATANKIPRDQIRELLEFCEMGSELITQEIDGFKKTFSNTNALKYLEEDMIRVQTMGYELCHSMPIIGTSFNSFIQAHYNNNN
ncbi:hypothetical protein JTE90_018465 [Oedothorax gibbosus]|uniref:PWWP domain-containing protein n=1 Tax=Oedothorax gibbosus TaxID=931172 RepID=A0AAV6UZU0_9ARAC|nr:hypothetical protein JTE90_018465 [Oedothorax gibbosus]